MSKKVWKKDPKKTTMRNMIWYAKQDPQKIIDAFQSTGNKTKVKWCFRFLNLFRFIDKKPSENEYETEFKDWVALYTPFKLNVLLKKLSWDDHDQPILKPDTNENLKQWYKTIREWQKKKKQPPYTKIPYAKCNNNVCSYTNLYISMIM